MIPKKIGRNEPCWCGSGIKYKKCHRDRENQKPVEHWEASHEFDKQFSKRICSAPDAFHNECSKKIIKAHTIPKSSSLKAIARNGHVYGFNFSLSSIRRHYGKVKPELIGVNRASTFTGFCKVHDDRLFAPIEKEPFSSSQQQCFLLAYRAFCRECYTKTAMSDLHPLRSSMDKGKSPDNQMEIQMKNFMLDVGTSAALKDNQHHKEKFDSALENGDFRSTQAIIFEFDVPPPVMVSGAVNPDFDFNGDELQDLGDFETVPDLLAVNSLSDGVKGYIVMSWLSYAAKAPQKLLQTLLEKPTSDLEKYLVQYMFKNFENCFIAPEWWNATSKTDKETLINIMADTVSLKSDPNGSGIATVQIATDFPPLQDIKFVNWHPKLL